jgi:rhodanese-related sulfurtransferase
LIMGAGFIIGGFCPGTSLVAAATGKLDGIFFVLGVFFGIFLFGETVESFETFWHSSYMGRFTLPELFGVDTGIMVLGLILMAIAVFWGGEHLERIFGGKDIKKAPKWRYGAAGALVLVAVVGLVIGQPTTEDRWQRLAPDKEPELAERAYQIHPGELLSIIHDPKINTVMLDVRNETDYNLFHILDSDHVAPEAIPALISDLHLEPANTVFVTISNDETAATDVWKTLIAESVPNVYILSGGINGWIDTFSDAELKAANRIADVQDDQLAFSFDAALGARYLAAEPNLEAFELDFEKKVKLEAKRAPSSGGCG